MSPSRELKLEAENTELKLSQFSSFSTNIAAAMAQNCTDK